ncbi:hypothetical protein SEA_DIZZYRUDY_31 [Microbacterium phage DizzyRudy]|nr:hypothetical protein SEA_DIZZYRUDY_31 [Microbacterium phage DizzyRudy]WMI34469.1 membrane protein [Microbacterium phage Damascus]
MDKKDVAIAASAIAITVLAVKLQDRTRKLDRLKKSARKLVNWTEIAQKVIRDTWEKHPELVGELPEDILVDISFYNIMTKEDLT